MSNKNKTSESEVERFLYICRQSGLSQIAFGASLGLSKSQVSHIINKRTKPSREVLDKLAIEYGVNLTWFITGQGNPKEGQEIAFVELINQEAAAGKGVFIEELAETNIIPVPHTLIHPHKPSKLKAVFVNGDSMTGEKIYDGDIVIFHPMHKSGNSVYVVSVGNCLLVKRLDFNEIKQTITLISANQCYPPRVLSGKKLESVRIEGRVIACLHRM